MLFAVAIFVVSNSIPTIITQLLLLPLYSYHTTNNRDEAMTAPRISHSCHRLQLFGHLQDEWQKFLWGGVALILLLLPPPVIWVRCRFSNVNIGVTELLFYELTKQMIPKCLYDHLLLNEYCCIAYYLDVTPLSLQRQQL